MTYPYGAPSSGVQNVWHDGNFTPETMVAGIIDNVTPVNKNTMRNSLGYQISLVQNFVNQQYLGREETPVNSGYFNTIYSNKVEITESIISGNLNASIGTNDDPIIVHPSVINYSSVSANSFFGGTGENQTFDFADYDPATIYVCINLNAGDVYLNLATPALSSNSRFAIIQNSPSSQADIIVRYISKSDSAPSGAYYTLKPASNLPLIVWNGSIMPLTNGAVYV